MFSRPLSHVRLVRLAFAAAALGLSAPTWAQSATGTLTVRAQVTSSCSVTTTAVDFGTYDVLATGFKTAEGSVTVACASGTKLLGIALGGGNAPNTVAGTRRAMSDGTGGRIGYDLYQPASTNEGAACAFTTFWGTSGAELFVPQQATNRNGRTYKVCGRTPLGQDAPVGSYTDQVSVTVTF